ncbi:MAG: DUF2975 domain-containing protein [Peptococcaceae bacterium]|jgi:hypothetical protein|nr:DUF2975 domain-containing protein [Peptococcaceae bacterium]
MSSKTLCAWVRLAVVAVAVCGLILCGYVLPSWGAAIVRGTPEVASWYLPWLLFLWAAALPCFAILWLVWKVAGAIQRETVFTLRTARWIKSAAGCLFADVGFFFAGNVIFVLMGRSHPGILLLSLFGDILGVALAILAAVLSRYITKAAVLQEESEGTI